jgi:hypothetical protein
LLAYDLDFIYLKGGYCDDKPGGAPANKKKKE